MTKILGKLPADNDQNGLNALATKLIEDPERRHFIIAVIDCSKTETLTDTDETEATVRVLRVEAVNDADQGDARRMMREANSKRTGRTVLDGLDFDHDTGEVLGQ